MRVSAKRQYQIFLGLCLLLVLLGTVYAGYRASITRGYTDFDVYYLAGKNFYKALLGQKVNFFAPVAETSPYRYSPLFGWFFAPLSLLPPTVARVFWSMLQWGFYGLSIWQVNRYFRLSPLQTLGVILGTLRFAVDNSNIGQISAFVTWLLVCAATVKSWKGISALSLAVFIKAQPIGLLFVPIFLREYRRLKIFFGVSVLLMIFSFSFGPSPVAAWIRLLSKASSVLDPATVGNQSLYGVCLRGVASVGAFGQNTSRYSAYLCTALTILGGFAALMLWRRNKWERDLGWAIGLALLPVFGVLTWKNTYLLWVFPFAYFLARGQNRIWLLVLAFLLASEGLIGNNANGFLMRWGWLPLGSWLGLCLVVYFSVRNPVGAESTPV